MSSANNAATFLYASACLVVKQPLGRTGVGGEDKFALAGTLSPLSDF